MAPRSSVDLGKASAIPLRRGWYMTLPGQVGCCVGLLKLLMTCWFDYDNYRLWFCIPLFRSAFEFLAKPLSAYGSCSHHSGGKKLDPNRSVHHPGLFCGRKILRQCRFHCRPRIWVRGNTSGDLSLFGDRPVTGVRFTHHLCLRCK